MMYSRKCTFLLCILLQVFKFALSVSSYDIEYGYDDDLSRIKHIHPDPELRSIEFMMMREMADDEPDILTTDEKRMRDALVYSMDTRNRRTFSEMIPILRSLSNKQRLALAALIASQTNPKSSKSMDLTQVDELFGEQGNLILPIINDIANIVKRRSNDKSAISVDNTEPKTESDEGLQTFDVKHRTKRSTRHQSDDKLSYHERKLNMTNFRGTAESNDQHAIESQTHIHVSLPNANISHAMTMEEVEYLALSDLNATLPNSGNGSVESLPEPEMLIRPYRVRPRPLSERFDNIYLYVVDYPVTQIMGSINRHKYAMTALLADNSNEWRSRMQELEAKKRREDEDNNIPTSGMCQSIVRYARPQKARSASGEWKYIVNTGQHTQTLRLEKCTHPEQSCTYLTDNFSSRCAQIYNYHRLLSWDSKRGLHIDIFKVPTCCTCQIDGYREKFPPVSAHGTEDQELFETRFSASDALYSLANNDYNDNDNDNNDDLNGDSTGSIYASNDQHKKQRPDKRKATNKKRPAVPHLDSYLTPPNPNQVGETDLFKRKQSIGLSPNRVSERKTSQPILIGNDDATELRTDRPSKNGFTPINVPAKMNQPPQRLQPSKVLIKRVNYNYHPIIDFFFRDRSVKSQKPKDRSGHKHLP